MKKIICLLFIILFSTAAAAEVKIDCPKAHYTIASFDRKEGNLTVIRWGLMAMQNNNTTYTVWDSMWATDDGHLKDCNSPLEQPFSINKDKVDYNIESIPAFKCFCRRKSYQLSNCRINYLMNPMLSEYGCGYFICGNNTGEVTWVDVPWVEKVSPVKK